MKWLRDLLSWLLDILLLSILVLAVAADHAWYAFWNFIPITSIRVDGLPFMIAYFAWLVTLPAQCVPKQRVLASCST